MLFGKKKKADNSINDDRIQVDTRTITTMVGEDTVVKGEISTEASIRINGTVIGDVKAGGVVVLTRTGAIEGTIEAESIIVAGVVKGNMSIRDKVNVEASGEIYGEVITKKFVIDEESIFQGNCVMNREGKVIPVPPYISEEEKAAIAEAERLEKEKAEKEKAEREKLEKEKAELAKAKKELEEKLKKFESSEEKDETVAAAEDDSGDSIDVKSDKSEDDNIQSEADDESNIEEASKEADDDMEGQSEKSEKSSEEEREDNDLEDTDTESDKSAELSDDINDQPDDVEDREADMLESEDTIIIADINNVQNADDIPASDGIHSQKKRNKKHQRGNYIKRSKSLSVEIENN